MKRVALNVQAISPLAIRSDHAPGGAESAKYISGTALAGSLAAVYRLYHPDDTTNFERLFLKGEVQYPDLYPANFGNKFEREDDKLPVYPLPKTAESCKRFPGFRNAPGNEKLDDPGHGIRDSLLDWAMYKLADKVKPALAAPVLLTPFQKFEKCPQCGKPIAPFSAYYRRKDGYSMIAMLDTRLQTHTGINRETGTVQESILYNRRVFGEQSRFWGMVRLDDELVLDFEQFIQEVGNTGLVRIGTGRTRGLGKVHLTASLLEDESDRKNGPDRFALFKERLSKFDGALRKRAELVKGFKPELKPFYFALTLHSPAILCDELLRYRGTIDEDMLANMTGRDGRENPFQVLYRSASTRRITGWNELWGTPRTNDVAINSGSVFLFESEMALEDIASQLYTLEEEGIGKRRAEGFGRVYISDTFHLEVDL